MSDLPPRAPRHWIEYVATAAALLISAVSLWVAIRTEDANNKMVAAASWPLLQIQDSNANNDQRPEITLGVINSGVGPAKLETMEVAWQGRSYRSSFKLLSDCCGYVSHGFPAPPGEPHHTPMTVGNISDLVIRAGETRIFIDMPLGSDNNAVWEKFDRVRSQLVFRACYCSVFDECWVSALRNLNARRVDRCPAVAVPYFE